jgi:hypothetical protein
MLITNPIESAIRFYACQGRVASWKILKLVTGQNEQTISKSLPANYKPQIDLPNDKNQQLRQQKIAKIIPKLRFIPGVHAIAICNSESLSLQKEGSDIDLFIVLEAKIFFTARLLITIFLSILGVRRHGQKIKNRFCLSFFVSNEKLNLSPIAIAQDIYLYYWCLTLDWQIVPNHDFPKNFLNLNRNWLEKIGPLPQKITQTPTTHIAKPSRILTKLLQPLEPLIKKILINRARQKNQKLGNPQGVIIEDGILKFHVIDRREEVRDGYKQTKSTNN